MQMTNEQMAANIDLLSGLQETGKLGYAIARNLRKLKDTATEYLEAKQKMFQEYGEDIGDGRVRVDPSVLVDVLGDLMFIQHEADVYQVDEDTFTSGTLTSAQMEKLLWMVEE